MRVPGGAPLAWVWGFQGTGALAPPTCRPFGRAARAHYPLAVGAGVRAWGPVTNPTARTLACWLCALWGRHEGAWGGRLLPWCGASGVGRSPITDQSSFQACVRGRLPTGCGCRGCGPRDLSPTPQRALLRAGFARCGGGKRAPSGGAPHAWVWDVRGRALSHPRPLVRSGMRLGPTTHWLWVRGVLAWGPVTHPTARALASWLCALWGWHEGARGGRLLSGCGASGVRRSPTPDLSSVRACGRGPLPTGCGCGGCGRGDPSPTPTARALASRLRVAMGRRGGATATRTLGPPDVVLTRAHPGPCGPSRQGGLPTATPLRRGAAPQPAGGSGLGTVEGGGRAPEPVFPPGAGQGAAPRRGHGDCGMGGDRA